MIIALLVAVIVTAYYVSKLSKKIVNLELQMLDISVQIDVLIDTLKLEKEEMIENIANSSEIKRTQSDEVKRKIAEGARKSWEKRKAAKQAQQPEEETSKPAISSE